MTPTPPPAPAEAAMRAITPESQPVFPCWLYVRYRPLSGGVPSWEYAPSAPDMTAWNVTHWHPDQRTAPTVPPAHGEHQGKPVPAEEDRYNQFWADKVTAASIERERLEKSPSAQPAQGKREATGTDTPRTDEQANISSDPEAEYVLSDFARTLERELETQTTRVIEREERLQQMQVSWEATKAQLSAQSARLAEVERALEVESGWVKSLTKDNGILLEAADATKAGAALVSMAGLNEALQSRALAAEQKLKEVEKVMFEACDRLKHHSEYIEDLKTQLQQAQAAVEKLRQDKNDLRAALKAYTRADEFTNALEDQAKAVLKKTAPTSRPTSTTPANSP
jgi:hypothetical protein